MWYFKTFMVDARPLKQTKAWLKLVLVSFTLNEAFPGGSEGKASACNAEDPGSIGKIPWRGKWQPTPVLLPEDSQGWRNLVGYSPCGCRESDMTERLHFHFHLEWTNKSRKSLYTISRIRVEGPDPTSACFPDSPQRQRKNFVVSKAHSDWKTSRSGEPRAMACSLSGFVSQRIGLSALKSPTHYHNMISLPTSCTYFCI